MSNDITWDDEQIVWDDEQQRRAPSIRGTLSEMGKGIARGAMSLPRLIAEQVAPQALEGVPAHMRLQQRDTGVKKFYEQIKPSLDAAQSEQMLGTGAELATSMIPFAGGPGTGLARKIANVGVPAAGGAIGEQVGGEGGKMIGTLGAPIAQAAAGRMLSPHTSKEVKMLMDAGVRPTLGELFGGRAKRLEEASLVKEFTGAAHQRAVEQFNTATFNRALAPIGGKVDKIGYEGFAQADEIAQAAYNNLLPNLTIKADLPFFRELAQVRRNIPKDSVQAEMQGIFNNVVTPYLKQSGAKGQLTPEHFKAVDSELGRLARMHKSDPSADSRLLYEGLRETQEALRSMVTRQNPQYAEPLKAANQAWANLIRIEDAVGKSSQTAGVFTPAQLQKSVKSIDQSLRGRSFAKGQAVLQDWSNAGIKVLGDSPHMYVPYSIFKSTVGGGRPGNVAPVAIAAANTFTAYNPVTQPALAHMIASRPDWMRQIGGMAGSPGMTALGSVPLFSQGEQ